MVFYLSGDTEWLLGVILCLVGAAATNLGLTLQKLSFIINDSLSLEKQQTFIFQWRWCIGFIIFIMGQLLNFIAFGFTTQAVAATLASFSLVTNSIFAPLLLKEKLNIAMILSTVIIIAGSITVVYASSHTSQDYTLQQLLSLYERPLFIIYISLLLCWLIIAFVYLIKYDGGIFDYRSNEVEKNNNEHNNEQTLVDMNNDNNIQNKETNNIPQTKIHNIMVNNDRNNVDIPIRSVTPLGSPGTSSYINSAAITPIMISSIFSSCSVLFAKCTIQLVKTSINDTFQFYSPISWIITIIFLFCAIASLHFLSLGLKRGPALFIIPLYYVLNTSLAIIGGCVYFEEFTNFSLSRMIVFIGGVLATLFGVWIASLGSLIQESDEKDLKMILKAKKKTSVYSFIPLSNDDLLFSLESKPLLPHRSVSVPNLNVDTYTYTDMGTHDINVPECESRDEIHDIPNSTLLSYGSIVRSPSKLQRAYSTTCVPLRHYTYGTQAFRGSFGTNRKQRTFTCSLVAPGIA